MSPITVDQHLSTAGASTNSEKILKHKRRYCRETGCTRIVKSQGLCQRHGAKPKKCKIECCSKQAQGNFDGMCKSHFKAFHPPKLSLETNIMMHPPLQSVCEEAYKSAVLASKTWHNPSLETKMPRDEDDYDVIPLNIWDDAFCGDAAYIEALASGLLDFPASSQHHNRHFSFEGFGGAFEGFGGGAEQA